MFLDLLITGILYMIAFYSPSPERLLTSSNESICSTKNNFLLIVKIFLTIAEVLVILPSTLPTHTSVDRSHHSTLGMNIQSLIAVIIVHLMNA